MDAIDILGSLLGRKTGQGGRGGNVLNDIFGKGSKSTPKPSRPPSADQIQREADQLEDMLNVAQNRSTGSSGSSNRGIPTPRTRPSGSPPDDNERALVLVRAMISAAKADGRLDEQEQEKILKQLHDPSADAVRFLREEFHRPVNLPELVSSVPIGMEQQVYTMSLIAIDLDTGEEAKYMMELAESLRLPTEVREQIHQRLGAPSIY
jgi:uncharacterized membrane protein YebE (DUF533 family)